MPRVPRILRDDAALFARIVARRFRGVGRLLLENSDGCLANVDARPGQHVGDLHLSERWAEQLDLLDGVTDEVREPINLAFGCPLTNHHRFA